MSTEKNILDNSISTNQFLVAQKPKNTGRTLQEKKLRTRRVLRKKAQDDKEVEISLFRITQDPVLWKLTDHFSIHVCDVSKKGENKEATMGIEPMMRVLQTPALPLGHVA